MPTRAYFLKEIQMMCCSRYTPWPNEDPLESYYRSAQITIKHRIETEEKKYPCYKGQWRSQKILDEIARVYAKTALSAMEGLQELDDLLDKEYDKSLEDDKFLEE